MNGPQNSEKLSAPQHISYRMNKLKNPKAVPVILFIVSALLLFIFQLYNWFLRDTTAPELTCPDGVLDVSITVTDDELMSGVSAQDNRDGDLTNNIVVETLSTMGNDHTREVTYAVMDLSGNVCRNSRIIRYTDYEPPRILIDAPLLITSLNQIQDLMENIHVTSTLDGDLSAKLKYMFPNGTYSTDSPVFDIELRVDDSTGTSTIIPTMIEYYNPTKATIPVVLKEYILYLHVGDAFVPEYYFGPKEEEGDQPAESDAAEEENGPLKKDEELFIDSDVDTSVPGVYHVTYTVENEIAKTMGRSRLIVVVE